jgi:eukaryotic-like serine/threonine-protein kinase
MNLQIGAVIKERYRILNVLASGGMGTIYRAKDESLGVEVALKVTLPETISTERMQKNTSILAGLHHPGIPRITDTFVLNDGSYVLVMDFIPGEDLKSRIEKKGPMRIVEAIEITSAIGGVLQYLHRQTPPIIHQDVKPGNIRITPEGKAILVDFDLAITVEDNKTRPSTHEQGLTPGFAAPEQYNRMVDTYSDQYGLAATLFYLLTATMLPDGISRASGNSKLPEHASARIPLDILTCLEKALQINPSDRYTDVQAFLDSLSSIVKTQPELSSAATRKSRNVKNGTGKKLIISIALALAGLAIVITVGWMLTNRSESGHSTPVSAVVNTIEVPLPASISPQKTVEQKSTNTTTPMETGTSIPVKEVKPTPLGGGSGIFAYVSEASGIPQILLGSTTSQSVSQLTNVPEGACQPDWSPDGNKIVFVSPCQTKSQLTGKSEPYSGSGLFIFTIENKQVIPIPSQPGGDFDPSWSPDGNQIAYTSNQNKYPQIYLYDVNSDTTSQLTNTTGANRQPAWSPDGAKLAFSSNRSGSLQIWIMEKDGSNAKPFSIQNNGAAFTPDWSPDGKSLVYSQTNSLQLAMKKLENSDAAETILNPRLTYAANPDISPDGLWILFDSNLGGNYQIYRISIKGSGAEPLTPLSEKAYQPVWKPAN